MSSRPGSSAVGKRLPASVNSAPSNSPKIGTVYSMLKIVKNSPPIPALQAAARIIFHHAGSQRLWSKRNIVADPDRAADEFDVAPQCVQRQVQGVIDDEPPRRHEWALAQIKRVREARRIHAIWRLTQENRFDYGAGYFDMSHGE